VSSSGGLASGGAIYTSDQVTVTGPGVNFTNNTATDYGGAIAYEPPSTGNPSMTLTNVTFNGTGSGTGNTAGNGGAVYSLVNSTQGTITETVSGCLFSGNRATGGSGSNLGGGFYAQHTVSGTASASLTIVNSTFYNNTTPANGGGIALQMTYTGTGSNTVALTSLTVTKNTASVEGGGLYIVYFDPTATTDPQVRNSIIAGNQAENDPDVFGRVSSAPTAGYDLIGVVDPLGSTGWNSSCLTGTIGNPKDPGLDPNGPADNGGPTFTIKLVTGRSLAYQNGDPNINGNDVTKVDQRGYTRATKATIGAYDPDATPPGNSLHRR
jgi:hypothetical protein